MSIFITAVCPLEEAQKSGVLPFCDLNLLKVCIITHAFPYFVHSIYVSFSLDQKTNNLDMTSCRGYVKSSLSCLWKKLTENNNKICNQSWMQSYHLSRRVDVDGSVCE